MSEITRGNFNEIDEACYPVWVKKLIDECETAGVFTTGFESDRKGRGEAINVSLYGFDESKELAVIQVRQCRFRPNRYKQVRKDYYLVGHTEIGSVFAHPVESPLRSNRAMSEPENCVAYVEAQIWDCTIDELRDIVRQGDVAFVPARLPASAAPVLDAAGQPVKEVLVRETHKIIAGARGAILKSGDTYYVAREAKAEHTKRQHAPIRVRNGFYRVVAGYRAAVWGFSAPKGD